MKTNTILVSVCGCIRYLLYFFLNMNFSLQVLQYQKLQYQEGQEKDVKFLCSDGVVAGGSLVISFASRFLRLAIDKEKAKQTQEDHGKPIELNFKLYSTKIIKVKFTKNIPKIYLHYLAVDRSYLWRKRRSSITKSWTANHGICINIRALQTTRRKRQPGMGIRFTFNRRLSDPAFRPVKKRIIFGEVGTIRVYFKYTRSFLRNFLVFIKKKLVYI